MRQTALPSASGLVAGAAITAVLAENYPHGTVHDPVVPLLARIAPLVCLTLISLCVARWMLSCAADTLRPAGIARREEAVTRSTTAAFEARIKAEKDARKRLLAEHRELTDDYNRRLQRLKARLAVTFLTRGPVLDRPPGVVVETEPRVVLAVGRIGVPLTLHPAGRPLPDGVVGRAREDRGRADIVKALTVPLTGTGAAQAPPRR